MFEKRSDDVIATVVFEDGEKEVNVFRTTDGKWRLGSPAIYKYAKVIAWMPLPEPYKED